MTPSFSTRRFVLAILFFLTLGVFPAVAQDTRGGLVPDAPVTLANGSTVEAQDLKAGAVLWAWLPEGKAGTTKVTAVRRQNADAVIFIKAGDRELRAMGSFRVALAGGTLVRLDKVKLGDKVWIVGDKGPQEALVTSVRPLPATMVTYDLMVEGHRLFQASGVVVGD